jgi:hypothetical protein
MTENVGGEGRRGICSGAGREGCGTVCGELAGVGLVAFAAGGSVGRGSLWGEEAAWPPLAIDGSCSRHASNRTMNNRNRTKMEPN